MEHILQELIQEFENDKQKFRFSYMGVDITESTDARALIVILYKASQMMQIDREEHIRQLDVLGGAK